MLSELKLNTILDALGINPGKPSWEMTKAECKEVADAVLGLDLAVADSEFTMELIKMLIADLSKDMPIEEIMDVLQVDKPATEMTVAKAEEMLSSISNGPIKIV
jgi:hypothetical protein